MFATRQIILFFIDNTIQMPVIRIVLLFIVVGGLALFAFSNLSPVLSLGFLGMQTPVLPLATWIGFAIASGVFTSLVLQFLQFLLISSSPRRFTEPLEVPPQTRPFRRDYEDPVPNRQSYNPPQPETPKTTVASDWEEHNGENWEFDESASTSTRQGGNRARETDQSDREVSKQSTERSNETTQQPQSSPPSGAYSYSYREREQKQAGVGKADVVYDANYRVIVPPNQTVEPEDDEEDWGFEDDDDFNDESKNTKARRS